MKVIVEKIPNLARLNHEDLQLNMLFFYNLLTIITNSEAYDVKTLSETVDNFFHKIGENTLRRIVFMSAYNEQGMVIVTKFDYEHVALIECDTSYLYDADDLL